MYKFTITYYYRKHPSGALTGCTDITKTRKAIIYADNIHKAKEKLVQIDHSFIKIADDGLLVEECVSKETIQ